MSCPATNGTYRCHRAATHRGDHLSTDGTDRVLRWGSGRTYSQRLAPILERGLAGES